jgi:hypothetical protein
MKAVSVLLAVFVALTVVFASISVWEYSEISSEKTTIGMSSTNTTNTSTACTAPTSTSPNLFYGSCLAVSGASLTASFGQLTLTFSMYGAPNLGVASVTLTGPTLSGVCALDANGLPNNATISTKLDNGTSTTLSGVTSGQIKLNFSGCNGDISPNTRYAYTLVSDWEESAFVGTVTSQ